MVLPDNTHDVGFLADFGWRRMRFGKSASLFAVKSLLSSRLRKHNGELVPAKLPKHLPVDCFPICSDLPNQG